MISRRGGFFALVACAVAAIGLVVTAAMPASAAVPPRGGLAFQRTFKPGVVTVVGAPAPGAGRYFTVFLNSSDAANAATVANYFKSFGMAATVLKNNKSIRVYGTNAQAAAAGHTTFQTVKVANQTFVRTAHDPTFPSSIQGLVAATSMSPGPKMEALNIRPFATVNGPQNGYGPADFAGIYNISPAYAAGITGAGRTISVAACNDIQQSDVSLFESNYGLPSTVINVIPIDGPRDGFADLEPTLDVERVLSTAPGTAVNLYVVPDCTFSEFADMINQIAIDNNADAVSTSYGQFESVYGTFGFGADMLAQHKALHAVVIDDGIPFFAASGDSGSWCGTFFCPFFENFTDVEYPASDSYVIGVGGTTVEESTIGTRLIENAWGSSGGGVSGVFGLSSWQVGYPGLASGLFKNIPDVSLDADPNTGAAEIYFGTIFPIGGTSVGAPTTAAILALIDQNRAMHGHSKLTNVGKALFAAHADFHDITAGANGYYPALKGFDNVTGIGVPNVWALVQTLQ
jgi:kumamolisin